MLKKAGIVVATAAAGLLAVSPLAFAGDYSGDNNHNGGGHHKRHSDNRGVSCNQDNSAKHRGGRSGGLISVSGNTVQVPVQACGNNVITGVLGIFAKNLRNENNNG